MRLRRIVVALDASANSQAALRAATALAQATESELLGLFVEDVNVLRLSELPFGREIRFPAAVSRPLDTGELEQQLRRRAAQVRRELGEIADAHQVRSTFRVVRGRVDSELLAAALEADLLALGRLGHSLARRARLGSTAWAAVTGAGKPVLLVRPSGDLVRPLVVIDDGTAAGERALGLSLALLRHFGSARSGEMRVLVWAPDDERAFARRQALAAMVEGSDAAAEFQHFHDAGPEHLVELIERQTAGLLVLPVSPDGLPLETVRALLENAQQHVLVVR
jgi:nucleotide-binding universal stress UspA family protein